MTSEQSASVEKITLPDLVFYGGAGAGKSTAADYLIEKLGYRRMSFAQKLKDIAVDLWGPDAAKDRGKLQALGTLLREIDEDVWVNAALKDLDAAREITRATRDGKEFPVVNDDCRFPNEYWRLKERGFYFIRVLAREELRVDRLLRIGKLQDPEQLKHESETAINGQQAAKEGIVWDYTLFNNDGKSDLRLDIDNILTDILEYV